jgi:regulatory protein
MIKKSALQYALDLLKLRDRTEAEIKKKLKEKEYPTEEIGVAIDWLKTKRFLDDERFVQNFIKSRAQNPKNGKRKILFKLSGLGLGKDLVDQYANQFDEGEEMEKAKALAEKWLRRHPGDEKAYQKIGQHLAGKGYEIDTIKQVLREILTERKDY